jgi:hypothetical protein
MGESLTDAWARPRMVLRAASVATSRPMSRSRSCSFDCADSERSWVILTEANRFAWPGPDLRPIGGNLDSVAYGLLPQTFFNQMKERFVAILRAGQAKAISRTE